MSSGASRPRVRIALGGSSLSADGQRRSPSRATSYSKKPAGSRLFDPDQGEVVAFDREGRLAAAEHLDLAGLAGLDPDGRLRFGDVAQQRAEQEIGHLANLPSQGNFRPRTAPGKRGPRAEGTI